MIENPDYYRRIYIADERIKRLEETEVQQEQYIEELEQCIRAANERIKRLEEAGNALYENSHGTKWELPECNARKLRDQEAWLKAKEGKP